MPRWVRPLEHVPLAPHCTLGVGGAARFFVEAADEGTIVEAQRWAKSRGLPFRVLGGGSNVVVADEGVPGLVVKVSVRGMSFRKTDGAIELHASAGEPWDALVGHTVERGWAGLECLSGIPGLVGATPIQNVGAYGQEVAETVKVVRALDCSSGRIVSLDNADCAFAYRDSVFKSRVPGRYVVLGVSYRLVPGGAPAVRYADVERDLAQRDVATPTLRDVRESVLRVRRTKSMVLDDANDPNRRSCGSFFVNPTVAPDHVARIQEAAGEATVPHWTMPDGRVKVSAAWLIEHAGFRRGHTEGRVGLSSRHALAIVTHDGAAAGDVIAFARRLRAAVEERFGVKLAAEPVFWGAE